MTVQKKASRTRAQGPSQPFQTPSAEELLGMLPALDTMDRHEDN